jgi:hypothetical protein
MRENMSRAGNTLNRKIEMFSPQKKTVLKSSTISVVAALATLFVCDLASGQQAEYQRRAAAMQQARARIQATMAQTQATVQASAPAARVARQSQASSNQSLQAAVNRVAKRTTPAPRTAQLIPDGTIIDGGSPIIMDESYIDGGVMTAGEVIYDDGVVVDGCGSCGDAGAYFEDDCCGRGGCPDCGPCWLDEFASALRSGEYFGGATAFRTPAFTQPGQTDANLLAHDCNFGFYGGVNFGVPLCRLSCGWLSGQLGFRSVQTNFNGDEFSLDNRDQTFFTAGLYRRVDYGLQFGLVADILAEEWYGETDLAQIRGDLGWVYPGGSTIGFRFARAQEDDDSAGTFDGRTFTDFYGTTEDWYRFYYRRNAPGGGWGELFAGWSNNNHTILGLEFDMPLTDYIAMESGFTYYLNDDLAPDASNVTGGNINDAWNLFIGFAIRPQGRSYYRSYDRPMLPVADNGTMLIRRQSPTINR